MLRMYVDTAVVSKINAIRDSFNTSNIDAYALLCTHERSNAEVELCFTNAEIIAIISAAGYFCPPALHDSSARANWLIHTDTDIMLFDLANRIYAECYAYLFSKQYLLFAFKHASQL